MKASRSSDTACLIARSILLAAKDPGLTNLISSGTVDFLNRILAKDWFPRAAGSLLFRKMILTGERFLLPGIITHYLARKIHIEREVERAIGLGCHRVVVLGAGYDTLAWRLHRKHPGVEFIEIDHPATQRLKADSLGEGRNLTLMALDLGSDLPSSRLVNDSLPTAFVVEGLTMYLTPARIAALMTDLARLTGKSGRIIWTFMEKQLDGSLGFQGQSSLVAKWLGFCGEPFLWGLPRNELETFSRQCGLSTDRLADDHSLRQQIMAPFHLDSRPLARGELICTSFTLPS